MATSFKKHWQYACKLTGTDPDAKYTPEQRADIIYRAACRILGKSPEYIPACYETEIGKEYGPSIIALYKLQVIAQAINPSGWIQDWNSWEQRKWWPWFYMNKPGFRFNDSFCDDVGTISGGGSRLCLASSNRSDFMGLYCISLYRDLMAGGDLALETLVVNG